MSQTSKIQFLNILPLLINSVALLAVIWIVVPAPAYNIWLFSVVASEWSLLFSALALIGIICSLFNRDGNLWLASLAIGIIAFIISLYPLFSVIPAACSRRCAKRAMREYTVHAFRRIRADFRREN